MIEIKDARCTFRHASGRLVEALRGVSVTIGDGEFVCLVGRSGHGKSTLLRALAGLNPLSGGEIVVDGRKVTGPSPERGMVFQEDTVFPWMRVYDNVAFGLRALGRKEPETRRLVDEWLAAVKLGDFAHSWPKELSGGMRKRVAIATVFATGAKILLMDEPFGSLDYVTRLTLHGLLLDLWARTGRTIVFVTHDIEEALILGDRILVMSEGRLTNDIRVDLKRPRNEEERASPQAVAVTKAIFRDLGLAEILGESLRRRRPMNAVGRVLSRIAGYVRARRISILAIVALIVAWEIAGHLSPKSPLRESPLVPPFEVIFGRSLLGMSDYWRIDMWAPMPVVGGAQTYLGAFLALGYHSALTIFRLASGLVLGAVAGTVLGLLISWSPFLRKLSGAPLHMLRMFPLLAMIPLFQFWFGANNLSAIVFVAYGVGVVYFVATINAASNVQSKYIDYARTLGASKLRVYLTVVFPAILPELFSSIMLTLGLAWSAVIGAEYVGVDSGIGRMIIWAEFFSATGRMMLVTILLIVYAGVSYLVCRRIAARVLRWMPTATRAEVVDHSLGATLPAEDQPVMVGR